MNTAAKGRKNEHRSMRIFEDAGCSCMRSAASAGVFDFVAISRTEAVLVQVKSRDWPGTSEMDEIRDFVCPENFRKIVHRWRKYQQHPDTKEI